MLRLLTRQLNYYLFFKLFCQFYAHACDTNKYCIYSAIFPSAWPCELSLAKRWRLHVQLLHGLHILTQLGLACTICWGMSIETKWMTDVSNCSVPGLVHCYTCVIPWERVCVSVALAGIEGICAYAIQTFIFIFVGITGYIERSKTASICICCSKHVLAVNCGHYSAIGLSFMRLLCCDLYRPTQRQASIRVN